MKQARKSTPGRKPEHVKIEGNWKDAVKHALGRGKPKAKNANKRKGK
jgi:hypothetical protein